MTWPLSRLTEVLLIELFSRSGQDPNVKSFQFGEVERSQQVTTYTSSGLVLFTLSIQDTLRFHLSKFSESRAQESAMRLLGAVGTSAKSSTVCIVKVASEEASSLS